MNSSNKKTTILAVVLCVVIVALVLKVSLGPTNYGTNIGEVKKQSLIQRSTMAGNIHPIKKTIVMAPYSGYVKKIFVKIGDKVKQGDPLVSVVQSLQNGDNAFPLRSPLDGIVVQIGKAEGEYVKEGDLKEFILRIDDNSKYLIFANVPEVDRVKLQVGQEAIIKVSPILNKSYKGIIREMSLAANQGEEYNRSQNVEFPVKIEVMDNDGQIKSGMSTIIDVITHKKENVLSLGHEFVRQEDDQYYVITVDDKRKDIKVGMQNEDAFEILEGLSLGEKVKQIDFASLSDNVK